jgi:hypothetical protein
LTKRSKYRVSYVPNIYKKEVLLDFLSIDESPWQSERQGSKRNWKREYAIYDYPEYGWYCNAVKKGRVTECGQERIMLAQ